MKVPGLTEDKCVTLIGMAGAGKKHQWAAVAERLGWAYVDTDHLIESTYGARLQDDGRSGQGTFSGYEVESSSPSDAARAVLATGRQRSIGPKPCGI